MYKRQLYAKAASEVCRKLAPDVLLGIRYTAEDLELEPRPVRVTARRTDRPQSGVEGVRAALAPKQEEKVDQLEEYLARVDAVESRDALTEIMQEAQQQLNDEEYEALKPVANQKHGDLND